MATFSPKSISGKPRATEESPTVVELDFNVAWLSNESENTTEKFGKMMPEYSLS